MGSWQVTLLQVTLLLLFQSFVLSLSSYPNFDALVVLLYARFVSYTSGRNSESTRRECHLNYKLSSFKCFSAGVPRQNPYFQYRPIHYKYHLYADDLQYVALVPYQTWLKLLTLWKLKFNLLGSGHISVNGNSMTLKPNVYSVGTADWWRRQILTLLPVSIRITHHLTTVIK